MRRKIWQENDAQCSIIGTCLSLKELRKLARQCDLDLGREAGEFEIHVIFVSACSECSPVAKAVNKHLDKKYATAVRRFTKAKTDAEVRMLWNDYKAKGDIPGPYWALMTHPEATQDTRHRAFGDVHMLSHLAGATNRADIRRLAELETRMDRMAQAGNKSKNAYRKRLKALTAENRQLKDRVAALAKEAVSEQLKSRKHCTEAVVLENQALRRSLSSQSLHLSEELARVDSMNRCLAAQEAKIAELRHELREKQAEIDFLETEMERQLATSPCARGCGTGACGCDKAGTPDCPGPDLCGKRILYVGGKKQSGAALSPGCGKTRRRIFAS